MFEQIAPVEYDKCGRMKYNQDLHDKQGQRWDYEDEEYLIKWYNKIGLEEMSLALGRTEGTVANKVNSFRNEGRMVKESPNNIVRELKIKATKNPDQSVQSSILKQSDTLYHMKGGMQVAN